jgi:hypothetical protein
MKELLTATKHIAIVVYFKVAICDLKDRKGSAYEVYAIGFY